MHKGYLILISASCQLAMSKRKSYCVSFKLKAVETAEKKSKVATAREIDMDPKRIREYRTLIIINAGLI